MESFWNTPLFSWFGSDVILGNVLTAVLISSLLFWVIVSPFTKFLSKYFSNNDIEPRIQKKKFQSVRIVLYLVILTLFIWAFNLNFQILQIGQGTSITVFMILQPILILLLARLVDWWISQLIIHNYYINRDKKPSKHIPSSVDREAIAFRTVQYLVYVLAILIIIRNFNLDYHLFSISKFTENDTLVPFNLSQIFSIILIFLITNLLYWIITQVVLYSLTKNETINIGSRYAFNQLLRYILYVIAVIFTLEYVGIKMTLVWGGAAALLIGLGLGLQQTFNDLFSGILLLFDRTVEVGDVVQVENTYGKVSKIGIRTSQIRTRENTIIVVPNSKLSINSLENLSEHGEESRFSISVGVAYGSDVDQVRSVLLAAAKSQKRIIKSHQPIVRLTDFGDSGLHFELLFWTKHLMIIEDVKSDLRFEIIKLFTAENISIPFPHRHVIIQKDNSSS